MPGRRLGRSRTTTSTPGGRSPSTPSEGRSSASRRGASDHQEDGSHAGVRPHPARHADGRWSPTLASCHNRRRQARRRCRSAGDRLHSHRCSCTPAVHVAAAAGWSTTSRLTTGTRPPHPPGSSAPTRTRGLGHQVAASAGSSLRQHLRSRPADHPTHLGPGAGLRTVPRPQKHRRRPPQTPSRLTRNRAAQARPRAGSLRRPRRIAAAAMGTVRHDHGSDEDLVWVVADESLAGHAPSGQHHHKRPRSAREIHPPPGHGLGAATST